MQSMSDTKSYYGKPFMNDFVKVFCSDIYGFVASQLGVESETANRLYFTDTYRYTKTPSFSITKSALNKVQGAWPYNFIVTKNTPQDIQAAIDIIRTQIEEMLTLRSIKRENERIADKNLHSMISTNIVSRIISN